MSRLTFGSAERIDWKELRRRTTKLPLKRLGHAIEDWVAGQSPMGNSPLIDAKAFEWVERLEKNSDVIRQELVALLGGQSHLPNIQELSPRQTNLSREDGWKSYFFYLLGHRIDASYKRCPETGKLLDSIPGLALAFFSVLKPGMHIKRHRGSYKGVLRCHLGLIVPEPRTGVRMQVADKMIYWEEGKCVIFDDTHKHEVWNDTDGVRVVLLFDVCRPLPRWLTVVNKFVLGLGGYLPEAYRLLRIQREWEARSAALTTTH
jgi:aspartyl/asparaginyl beta-hydroxylase (cupin superfamily)